eukprot:gene50999-68266_t
MQINPAFADCWTVTNLSGTSSKKWDGYESSKDGISKGTFRIQIGNEVSAVVPSDLKCTRTSDFSVVCLHIADGKSTVETWSVDPDDQVAFYTKTTNGWGGFDGVSAFTGKAKLGC